MRGAREKIVPVPFDVARDERGFGMSDYSTIRLDLRAGVATLTLNRPEKRNALSAQVMDEFRDALSSLSKRRARALLLVGAGSAFCAGEDHSNAAIAITDSGLDPSFVLENSFHPAMAALAGLRIPVVAAVQGACTEIGVGVALCADFIVAARSAFFLVGYARIGLVPDGGTSWLLSRAVGKARATRLMMLAERLGAERAFDWGLVHHVVDDDQLAAEARSLAERLAAGPTRAFGIIRRSLLESDAQSFEQALAADVERLREAARSSDAREGLAAFLAKRPAQFTGR